MYIAPNSTLKLLKGVPLDNKYNDTIYFETKEAQVSHFTSYPSRTYDNLTYQRVNSGRVRIQESADSLYAYNYLMFRNTAYGNKWFYAFVTAINYINDNTTEIEYQLDVMQTWFFDYTLEPSYVEREHSDSDHIGEHLAGEPVATGAIVCRDIKSSALFNDYSVVVIHADVNGGAT